MSDNLRGAAWIRVSRVAATSMMLAVRGTSGAVHPLQVGVVGVFATARAYCDIRGFAAGAAGPGRGQM